MVNHYLDLILVAMLETQHLGFSEGGWELVQCFLSAVDILKWALLTMNHGHLEKRFSLT